MWWRILIFIYIVLGMLVTLLFSNKKFTFESMMRDLGVFLMWPFWLWFLIRLIFIAWRNPEVIDELSKMVDQLSDNLVNESDDSKKIHDEIDRIYEEIKKQQNFNDDEKDKEGE